MAKKTLIVNEGYSSNLGDQAIKASMEKLMHKLGFDTDFCYFTNPQLQELPRYEYGNIKNAAEGYFFTIKKNMAWLFSIFIYFRYYFTLRQHVRAKLQSQKYDKVVIGGGQLINSSGKRRISFFAIALFVWAKEVDRVPGLPLYLVGVGAAGKFHTIEKHLYKRALKAVAAIWVRDSYSSASILKFFERTTQLTPDVAFFEPAGFKKYEKDNTALVGIYSYDEYNNKFKVAEKNKEAYYEHWKAVVEELIEKGNKVLLFYTTVTDATETVLFQQYLDREQINTSIAHANSLQDLNKLFETAGSVYSARMHALILALKKGCNVEAYIISQKLQSFTDEYIKADAGLQKMSDGLYHTFESAFKPVSLLD